MIYGNIGMAVTEMATGEPLERGIVIGRRPPALVTSSAPAHAMMENYSFVNRAAAVEF